MRPYQPALNWLLAFVFVVSSQSHVKAQDARSPIADKWAVVIGIGEFADPNTPKLKYAAKDAQDFYNYLVDPKRGRFAKDHVRLLLNRDATKVNILDALGDQFLPFAAMPDDLVVIYLSTHGSPAGADIRGVNFVVAHDTELRRLYATGINLPDLLKTIKDRVHTKRILLCLDTCYSGAGAPDSGKGLVRTNIDGPEIAQGIGSLVIASSSPDQRSWESDSLRNSYFTKYLIDALGKADGMVSINQAFESMRNQVQADVLHDKGQLQTPTLSGKFEGPNLIIGAPPHVVRRAPAIASLPPPPVQPALSTPTMPASPSTSLSTTATSATQAKPPTRIALAPPAATPSASTLSRGISFLVMDYDKLPHELSAQKGEKAKLPEAVRRAAAAVASQKGAPIVLKQIVLTGGDDVTDQVLNMLSNPGSISQPTNIGPIAILDKDKVLSSWHKALDSAAKLKDSEKRISDLIARQNLQYDSKKASGMAAAELLAWQKQAQAQIDSQFKEAQNEAIVMEADLEKTLDAAISAELASRGLPVAISCIEAFNGHDITDGVIRRLNDNDLTSSKPVPQSTAIGVVDRTAVIAKFAKLDQAANDLKADEARAQSIIDDANKQYAAAKTAGKPVSELTVLQQNLQKKVDAEVGRLKRGAKLMEEALENDLTRAIVSAAQEKGVQTVLQKDSVYFGGIDITDTTIKYLK